MPMESIRADLIDNIIEESVGGICFFTSGNLKLNIASPTSQELSQTIKKIKYSDAVDKRT